MTLESGAMNSAFILKNALLRGGALLALLWAVACSPIEGPPTLEPAEGSSSGYYPVLATLPTTVDPTQILEVRVGDVRAYSVTLEADDRLRFFVQGSPAPGPADVVLLTRAGAATLDAPFTYLPPVGGADGPLARPAAFGASLTQGVQNGVPTHRSITVGPAAQLARAMGAWMPLPLLVPDLLPEMRPQDIGPPPDCAAPGVRGFVSDAASGIIGTLVDPFTGEFAFGLGRVDPELAPHNVAVGGFRIGDTLRGPDPDGFDLNFFGHLVLEPDATLAAPMEVDQITLLEAIEPTLIVTTDLYGNDVVNSILDAQIDLDALTPIEDVQRDLEEILARLSATGAEVFVSDLPRPSILPASAPLAGPDLDAVDAHAAALDALLHATAAEYDNVHVVLGHDRTEELVADGVDVAGHHLTAERFRGLLSMDGLHFSDTGYALTAQLFADAINDVLGTDIPPIDLAPIVAADPSSIDAVVAAGIDPEACD